MRKKIVFIILTIFLVFSFRSLADQIFIYSFNRYLKVNLQSEYSYEKIKKQKRRWSFYNLKITKKDVYDLYAEKLDLFVSFNWKKFSFLFHIESIEPKLTVHKDIEFSDQSFSKSVSLHLTKLELNFLHDKNSFCVNFFQKPFFNDVNIEVFSSKKQATPSLEISYVKTNISYVNCSFKNLEIGPYFKILKPFMKSPSVKCSGILNGSLSIQKKGVIDQFFSNVQLKDIHLFFKEKALSLDAHSVYLELEYPSCIASKKKTSKSLIGLLMDMRSKIKFQKLKVKSTDESKTCYLSDLKGFFSYNPTVGPKWSINGVSHTNESQEIVKTEGRGFLNSRHKDWIEGSVCFDNKCFAELKLSDDKKSFWRCLTKIEQLTEKQLQLFQDLLSSFYPTLNHVQFDKVSTSLEFSTLSNFENVLEFDVTNLTLSDLKVKSDQAIKQLELLNLQFKGSFNTASNESLTGVIDIEGGSIDCKDPIHSFKDIRGKLHFEMGVLVNSEVQLYVNKILASLNINGPIDLAVVKGKINGPTAGLGEFFLQKNDVLSFFKDHKDHFEGDFIIKKNNQSELYGTLKIPENNKETLQFGLFFKDSLLKRLSHGWVKGNNISLNDFAFASLKLDGRVNFTTSFEGRNISFLVKGSNLKIENDDFIFSAPYLGDCDSDCYESIACLQGNLDFKSFAFACRAPLKNCTVELKKYQTDFSDVNGVFHSTNRQMNFQLDAASCCNINFCGNVLFQSINSSKIDITIDTEKINGKIEDLIALAAHFNENMYDLKNLKGYFDSPINGFEFQRKCIDGQSKTFWRLAATFKDVRYDIANQVILDQMKGSINIDSKGLIGFEDLSSQILSAEKDISYDLYVPYLTVNEKEVEFDLRLSNSLRDIARLCGMALVIDEELQVRLDSSLSHFFSSKLKVDNFIFKENKVRVFALESSIDLKDFSQTFYFLKNVIRVPFLNKINFPEFFPMNGILNCSFHYHENEKSAVEISGSNLSYNRHPIQSFNLKAELNDNLVNVPHLGVNDINCNFLCKLLSNHLEFRDFNASMQDFFLLNMSFDLHDTLQLNGYFKNIELSAAFLDYISEKKLSLLGMIKGKGHFSIDLPHSTQKLQIESDLDLQTSNLAYSDYSFENRGPIRAYFSYNDGWILDGLTFNVFNAEKQFMWLKCKIGKLFYQPSAKKYIYKDVHLFFPEDLFSKIDRQSNFLPKPDLKKLLEVFEKVCANKEINTEGELDFESSEWIFNIKQHQIEHNNESYLFRNITTTITPNALVIDSKYISETFEFPLELKLYRDENMYGRLLLYEEKSERPMRFDFDFKNGFQLHSIVGSFHGMDARFQRDRNLSFVGSLKCDFKKIKDFVSPLAAEFFDALDMGSGYELRGKLSLTNDYQYQFQGIFTGKDIELGGCIYQTLMSNINIVPKSISISDLKVSDTSGIFKIDKLNMFNRENRWCFSIPNFKMLDLRPSLTHRTGQQKQEIKPLVFREILLIDVTGELQDKTTYKGHGHLSFINSFKRDHSVFDVPADFLGRIFGLDMELLIPVKGRADFKLKDGKFYFTDLENAYSEGNRSEFFLAEKAFPHTMDLNGELNIHIQMKHYVLFTFTESFILSIEGNLSDPKFSLKKKKTLFSSK